MLTVLCKCASLRMRLTVGVLSVLRCESLAVDYVGGFLLCLRVRRGGWCHLVGVIITAVLQNARCNNKRNI